MNGRLHQLDATYPDSYGSGTPATLHWLAGYEFGNAADGNLLTRLVRQRVDDAGAEVSVTNHTWPAPHRRWLVREFAACRFPGNEECLNFRTLSPSSP